MQDLPTALSLLTAMITPAVLISACGTLIFSTSARLARIVDRVRELSQQIEQLCGGALSELPTDRRTEVERQLAAHAQRSQLIQRSLTSFYLALGLFVATTVSIGVVGMLHRAVWVPSLLGIAGTVVLFYGSMLLIAETRVALRSVNEEMAFVLSLPQRYQVQSRGEGENGQEQQGKTAR
jgi:threonine/homoserine/homoserine lactone efflux protein